MQELLDLQNLLKRKSDTEEEINNLTNRKNREFTGYFEYDKYRKQTAVVRYLLSVLVFSIVLLILYYYVKIYNPIIAVVCGLFFIIGMYYEIKFKLYEQFDKYGAIIFAISFFILTTFSIKLLLVIFGEYDTINDSLYWLYSFFWMFSLGYGVFFFFFPDDWFRPKLYKKMSDEENQRREEYDNDISYYAKSILEKQDKLTVIKKQIQTNTSIPDAYKDYKILSRIISYLTNMRADTLKEAINLYHFEMNNEELKQSILDDSEKNRQLQERYLAEKNRLIEEQNNKINKEIENNRRQRDAETRRFYDSLDDIKNRL